MDEVLFLLKIKTQELHDNLETVSFAKEIMSNTISLAQYQSLISKNFSIYHTIEEDINTHLLKPAFNNFQPFNSQRLKDLDQDLSYFEQPNLSSKVNLPFTIQDNPAFMAGVLYVLEGSRLGGKVIVKALKKNAHLEQLPAFHFYEQKDIEIRDRWVSFCNTTRNVINNAEDTNKAIEGANLTFNYFYKTFASL